MTNNNYYYYINNNNNGFLSRRLLIPYRMHVLCVCTHSVGSSVEVEMTKAMAQMCLRISPVMSQAPGSEDSSETAMVVSYVMPNSPVEKVIHYTSISSHLLGVLLASHDRS